MGLYTIVSVATAAKYDLTTNVDVTDGLTNTTIKQPKFVGVIDSHLHKLQTRASKFKLNYLDKTATATQN